MGKVQHQSKVSGGNGTSNDEANDPLSGSTLEDYFASHKTRGQVSQHLLNASDVMAVEKTDEKSTDSGVGGSAEQKNEGDEYEDNYESAPKDDDGSTVEGMTLSDYFHVKEGEAQGKLARADSQRMLPPQLAAKKTNPNSTADVSGMSLDHYLGASVGEGGGDCKLEDRAERKSSPKIKRKSTKAKQPGPPLQQSFAVKGSSLTQVSQEKSTPRSVSSDDECSTSSPSSSLTPFQRRQKRKDRTKAKLQQRQAGSGSSVSKAILMDDTAGLGLSFREKAREKRNASLTTTASVHPHHQTHHGSHLSAPSLQDPLPKLAASPSVRCLSHKDHETSDKLPPL